MNKFDQNVGSTKLWQLALVLFVVGVVAAIVAPYFYRKYKTLTNRNVTEVTDPVTGESRLARV